ncbi:hypothetical protein LTR53_016470 [Teratosphaeriaceae sp. CCFEE 6253]|nr:hypothetical protein LTR53_016470 [Teratosphaeriaceae sp. CCFEE 6253]
MPSRPHTNQSPGDADAGDRPPKRRRSADDEDSTGDPPPTTRRGASRRKNACQGCRLRKVRCDCVRPACGNCHATDATCHYTEPPAERLTLDSATELLCHKLERLQDDLDELRRERTQRSDAQCGGSNHGSVHRPSLDTADAPMHADADATHSTESSSEFLQIPAHRTSADAVLTWEIFESRYPPSALIGVHFSRQDSGPCQDLLNTDETFTARTGLLVPNEEQIPALIESFLQNVHTKNPVLDADQLVRQARIVASDGLSWDAWSCLVLLAAALGRIAKPFDAATAMGAGPGEPDSNGCYAWAREAANTPEELGEAEAYFVLACRRLGGLKHSLLGSQCFFFAGVYLMYTLRPLLSWQYFIHASTLFRLYMSTAYPLGGPSRLLHPTHPSGSGDRTIKRLEECMYWSCFKSEIEFRVELPLPQSELASYPFPQMFPSPRSPARADVIQDVTAHPADDAACETPAAAARPAREPSVASLASNAAYISPRQRVARLCNEEESWYYYLTEIALRRIGNRIINTFFRRDSAAWRGAASIRPLLRIALEFDAQVSAWSANLPTAMKQWETAYAIRRPDSVFVPEGAGSHVLRELSWALENRLLEVRSWLYQPFLYWLIHRRPPPPGPGAGPRLDDLPDREAFTRACAAEGLGAEDAGMLFQLVGSGLDCSLKILDMRSLRHRHHGLWYDMRSTMCAALILLAVVRSGHEAWIAGGAAMLLGPAGQDVDGAHGGHGVVGGKIGQVMAAYEYWAAESADLGRHRDVLEEVARSVAPFRQA